MREFFREICDFQKTVSIKDSRQFIASIYNTVCGSTQTVLSSDAAGAFHHSVETHNAFYSDTVKNGALLRAMQFWTAVALWPRSDVAVGPTDGRRPFRRRYIASAWLCGPCLRRRQEYDLSLTSHGRDTSGRHGPCPHNCYCAA